MRVLIVDDDEDDFIITCDVLSEIAKGSFELHWIAEYEEAQAAIVSEKFDVVLLDYRLGARTGLELLAHAQAQQCKTPIILLTGLDDREVDVAGMRAGAVDYLNKAELRPDLLERAIRYAAERARTQAALTALNQQLLDEHTMLLRAERLSSIGVIAASVAHEINNPLCGVMGLFKGLRDRNMPDSKFNEYMASIQDGLERMRGTVQDLLDFVRERPLSITRVDVADVMQECLRLCGAAARKKRVEVKVAVRPAEAIVAADRARLVQGLLNILLNAIYATPAGGTVGISALRDKSRIGIRVTDPGDGIPSEILARICEPFFTTKPTGEGTGLGLAVASSIIKAHKGELQIESPTDRGTTITIWLADGAHSASAPDPVPPRSEWTASKPSP